jgi:hypothetical protein
MALEINASTYFLRPGGKLVVQASGGTAPYVYSLGSGDGGSIDSATGVYTAPSSIDSGVQNIKVVDNSGSKKNMDVYLFNVLQVLAKIIQNFTGISDDQIYIYNQKIIVPRDNRVYVAIKFNSVKIISSSSKYEGESEVLSTNSNASVSIDILSKTLAAYNMKENIVMAIRSSASQRIQDASSMKIGEIPTSFNDLSEVEGSVIPYRFNITFNMHYSTNNIQNTDYYDNFSDIDLETN